MRPCSSGPTGACCRRQLPPCSGAPPMEGCGPRASTWGFWPRSRVTASYVSSRSKTAASPWTICSVRVRHSSPPRFARCRPSRRLMRQNCQNVPASKRRRRRRHSRRSSSGSSRSHPQPEPQLDFQLTDEQRLISESAREFCDDVIAPRVRENDRAGRFDRELASRLGEMGYLGAPVAEEYGGRSLDYLSYALIVKQVGRVDSSARTVVSVQTSLVCGSIERWGTEEQKREWLPRLCSGEALGCFALTEPDAGSDPAGLRTSATKTDSGWTITGNKMWISMGNVAEVALVFAQTDPGKRHKGLACFLVPTANEGYGSEEIHGKLGLRSSDTAEISLDEVEVPEGALLGEIGDGFKVAMSALD